MLCTLLPLCSLPLVLASGSLQDDAKEVRRLAKDLKHRDPEERAAACQELRRYGALGARELVQSLEGKYVDVWAAASMALRSMGEEAHGELEFLIGKLENAPSPARYALWDDVHGLFGGLNAVYSEPEGRRLKKSELEALRKEAYQNLVCGFGVAAMPLIEERLTASIMPAEEQLGPRYHRLHLLYATIARAHPHEALWVTHRALNSKDPRLQAAGLAAAGTLWSKVIPDLMPQILRLTTSPEAGLRLRAFAVLRMQGTMDEPTRKLAAAGLADADEWVRLNAAALVLAKTRSSNASPKEFRETVELAWATVRRGLENEDPTVRAVAAAAIGPMPPRTVLDEALAAFSDPHADVRYEALMAIAWEVQKDKEVRAKVKGLTKDPDPRVKASAQAVLEKYPD